MSDVRLDLRGAQVTMLRQPKGVTNISSHGWDGDTLVATGGPAYQRYVRWRALDAEPELLQVPEGYAAGILVGGYYCLYPGMHGPVFLAKPTRGWPRRQVTASRPGQAWVSHADERGFAGGVSSEDLEHSPALWGPDLEGYTPLECPKKCEHAWVDALMGDRVCGFLSTSKGYTPVFWDRATGKILRRLRGLEGYHFDRIATDQYMVFGRRTPFTCVDRRGRVTARLDSNERIGFALGSPRGVGRWVPAQRRKRKNNLCAIILDAHTGVIYNLKPLLPAYVIESEASHIRLVPGNALEVAGSWRRTRGAGLFVLRIPIVEAGERPPRRAKKKTAKKKAAKKKTAKKKTAKKKTAKKKTAKKKAAKKKAAKKKAAKKKSVRKQAAVRRVKKKAAR